MGWPLVKQLHVSFALLTACSFSLRAYWMLNAPALLRTPWSRWLPHVIDALLFATGLGMAWGLSISPLAHPWLAAKLGALVVYVIIGSIALKRGRTRRARVLALMLSLLVLTYIFAVALTHDPWAGLKYGMGFTNVGWAERSEAQHASVPSFAAYQSKSPVYTEGEGQGGGVA